MPGNVVKGLGNKYNIYVGSIQVEEGLKLPNSRTWMDCSFWYLYFYVTFVHAKT